MPVFGLRPVVIHHRRRNRCQRRHADPLSTRSTLCAEYRCDDEPEQKKMPIEQRVAVQTGLSNVSLADRAYRIRRNALRMGEVQGQGYIAQALGIADVLAVAYFHALRYRPDDPEWEGRDRFLLSCGHYAIALYAALIEAGVLPEDELETYGGDDSRLPMSAMSAYTPGMEISG